MSESGGGRPPGAARAPGVAWSDVSPLLFLRLVGVAAVGASMWGPAREASTPRAVIAWMLLVAFAVVFVGGNLRWAGRGDRRWGLAPLIALSALVTALMLVLDLPMALVWLPFLVVLHVGRSLEPWPALAVAAPPIACLAPTTWRAGGDTAPLIVLGNLIGPLVMLAVTILRRRQREAEELAAAQREVIAAERTKAATAAAQRELGARLHDVLAHSLSGLVVSLTTASLQARSEGASPELLDRLDAAADLARSGLVEARHAVDALRIGRAPDAAPAGDEVGDREALAAWFAQAVDRLGRSAGVRVDLVGDLREVPTTWVPLARSVLMESLTNSLKHSPGADVEVTVDGRGLSVLSRAPGATGADPRDHPSGHHGLDGLRARAQAAGGRLDAGPSERGWLVRWQWGRKGIR